MMLFRPLPLLLHRDSAGNTLLFLRQKKRTHPIRAEVQSNVFFFLFPHLRAERTEHLESPFLHFPSFSVPLSAASLRKNWQTETAPRRETGGGRRDFTSTSSWRTSAALLPSSTDFSFFRSRPRKPPWNVNRLLLGIGTAATVAVVVKLEVVVRAGEYGKQQEEEASVRCLRHLWNRWGTWLKNEGGRGGGRYKEGMEWSTHIAGGAAFWRKYFCFLTNYSFLSQMTNVFVSYENFPVCQPNDESWRFEKKSVLTLPNAEKIKWLLDLSR